MVGELSRPGDRANRRSGDFDGTLGAVHAAHQHRRGAVTRLRDMGIEPFLLSSSLIGVLAQRLVRVLIRDTRAVHGRREYGAPPVEPRFEGQRGSSYTARAASPERLPGTNRHLRAHRGRRSYADDDSRRLLGTGLGALPRTASPAFATTAQKRRWRLKSSARRTLRVTAQIDRAFDHALDAQGRRRECRGSRCARSAPSPVPRSRRESSSAYDRRPR